MTELNWNKSGAKRICSTNLIELTIEEITKSYEEGICSFVCGDGVVKKIQVERRYTNGR